MSISINLICLCCRCSNILGAGSISSQLSEMTEGSKPIVPAPTAFLHPSNDSVRLDLHLWNSEECPVSYFVVEYRKRQVHWTYLNPKDSFSCIKNFDLFHIITNIPRKLAHSEYVRNVNVHSFMKDSCCFSIQILTS